MASYQPPFAITNHMVKLVSEIAEKIGRLDRYQSLDAKPCLRRNNRIRSIHSSLAIEANSLSDELGKFDPFSIDELKRLRGVMTYLTVDESGQFRRGEEGVFDGGRCIFMAPPAMRVSALMDDLFSWMKQARKDVHPLILSSVFHYEFVFIHPFADGNGCMARLWQTSLLCEWNRVFQYMPIESRIHAFQSEYYEAISKCHNEGSANSFIVFMLEKISETLDLYLQQASSGDAQVSEYVRRLLDAMEYDVPYSAKRIMELLNLKSKETLRRHYINPALEMGLIVMSMPDKPTSRNQAYVKK